MTGLEKITGRILADAKARAREVLETAQEECRRTEEDYRRRAAELHDTLYAEAEANGEALIARARSAAAMERRNVLLAARAEILNETFAAAHDEIAKNDPKKYRELLVALLASALLDQAKNERQSRELGDETAEVERFEVFFNEADRAAYGNAVVEEARKLTERRIGADKAARLSLAEGTRDIDGGLVLCYGDVETNCSLGVIFAEMRHTMEGKISSVLFPKGE